MKRIIITTALVLATLTNTAFAMTPTKAVADMIHRYAPMADVPLLSDRQLSDLMAIINSNDTENSKHIRASLVVERSGGAQWN